MTTDQDQARKNFESIVQQEGLLKGVENPLARVESAPEKYLYGQIQSAWRVYQIVYDPYTPKWIRVEDRLPSRFAMVLIKLKQDECVYIAEYREVIAVPHKYFAIRSMLVEDMVDVTCVSHWLEIPKIPWEEIL